jgi:hexosaminidase
VIKETDRPLGLYFVFYNEDGETIAEVSDYTFVPFTRQEQINRSPEDEETIPTAESTSGKSSRPVQVTSPFNFKERITE